MNFDDFIKLYSLTVGIGLLFFCSLASYAFVRLSNTKSFGKKEIYQQNTNDELTNLTQDSLRIEPDTSESFQNSKTKNLNISEILLLFFEMEVLPLQIISGISVLVLSIFSFISCNTKSPRFCWGNWSGTCGVSCFQLAEFHRKILPFICITLGFVCLWGIKIYLILFKKSVI